MSCSNTTYNKKCNNVSQENGQCELHNARKSIISSSVCRRLLFNKCDAYIKHRQEDTDETVTQKCDDYSFIHVNYYCYCEQHYQQYKYGKPDECAICTENIEYEKETPLQCGHWFHLDCLKNSDKMQCPLCRSFYTNYEVSLIHDISYVLFYNLKNPQDCDNPNIIDNYRYEMHNELETNMINNNEQQNDDFTKPFVMKVPRKIANDKSLGLNFIELLYMEIVQVYRVLHLHYSLKLVNKVMLNIFNNNEHRLLAIDVFRMFRKENLEDNNARYVVLEHISFEEENEYTDKYDRFQEIIENLYYSLL